MKAMTIRDGISPEIRKMARKFADRKPILKAMGAALAGISQEAFRNPSARPEAWKPSSGEEGKQTLLASGALRRSIRVGDVTNDSVTVTTDRVYAAIHQFGGRIVAKGRALHFVIAGQDVFVKAVTIPPRPYMPFDDSGSMTPEGRKRVEAAATAKMKAMMPPGTR